MGEENLENKCKYIDVCPKNEDIEFCYMSLDKEVYCDYYHYFNFLHNAKEEKDE